MDSGLRELLRDVGCGVLALVDGRVEFVNEALFSLFHLDDGGSDGATADELVGRLGAALADGEAFGRLCTTAMHTGRPVTADLDLADGRTFECDVQPVGAGDDTRGCLVLVWDVSPDRAEARERSRRQRAEIIAGQLGARAHSARADEAERTGRRLAARNEQLAATDAARVELLATASHELRTPLTSILSFSELIADAGSGDGAGGAHVVEYAEIVHRNARRLLDTVEDLLMLAALGSSARPPSTAAVDLGVVVRRVVEDLGPAAAAADVGVSLDVADDLAVRGDADEIVRMMCNVVDNAVKYSQPGTEVTIRAARVDGASSDAARIEIGDRGTGIPADEVALVFDQFYRASTARSSDRPGTGLGLAIAQGVAVHHGGSIALTSELGEGTTVTIELPLAGPVA